MYVDKKREMSSDIVIYPIQDSRESIIPKHHLTEMEENTARRDAEPRLTIPKTNPRAPPKLWCDTNEKKTVSKDKALLPCHRLPSIHQHHCRQTFARMAKRERTILPLSPVPPPSSDLAGSPHAPIHTHPFVCIALACSYNCRCAISPLVSSEAVKRHCSDGGGGRACVRMYVRSCSSVSVRE